MQSLRANIGGGGGARRSAQLRPGKESRISGMPLAVRHRSCAGDTSRRLGAKSRPRSATRRVQNSRIFWIWDVLVAREGGGDAFAKGRARHACRTTLTRELPAAGVYYYLGREDLFTLVGRSQLDLSAEPAATSSHDALTLLLLALASSICHHHARTCRNDRAL